MTGTYDLEIRLAGELGYFGLEGHIARLAPLFNLEGSVRYHLNMRDTSFVSPSGMALVRCVVQRVRDQGFCGQGSAVTLPSDPDVRRYVRRMDAFSGLVVFSAQESFGRRDPHGFVPVEEFRDENQAGMAAVRIVNSFGLSEDDVRRRLQCNLNEITENVIYHSGCDHGLAVAQTWSGAGKVEFAIADHGMGVAASMRANPRHQSLDDLSAVSKALEQGGTAVENERRGQGLWTVSQAVERNGGHMLVRTGPVEYRQHGADRHMSAASVALPGTLVAMRFDLRESLDIDDILTAMPQDEYGFISFSD